MVAISPGSMIPDSPPSLLWPSPSSSSVATAMTVKATCTGVVRLCFSNHSGLTLRKAEHSLFLWATDGGSSQEVAPALASSRWCKCELISATQRQGGAALKNKEQAEAFWLTPGRLKLVYHQPAAALRHLYSIKYITTRYQDYSQMKDTAVTATDLRCQTVWAISFFLKRCNIYFKTFCVKNKIPDRSSDRLCGISSNKNTALWANPACLLLPCCNKMSFQKRGHSPSTVCSC